MNNILAARNKIPLMIRMPSLYYKRTVLTVKGDGGVKKLLVMIHCQEFGPHPRKLAYKI